MAAVELRNRSSMSKLFESLAFGLVSESSIYIVAFSVALRFSLHQNRTIFILPFYAALETYTNYNAITYLLHALIGVYLILIHRGKVLDIRKAHA